MAASLVFHACLAAVALALRKGSKGVIPSTWAPEQFQAGQLQAGQRGPHEQKGAPTIEAFRELWERRRASEMHLGDPMPSSIRLILGVFTTAPDIEYREVVRNTWKKQKGVCYWRDQPKEGCSVYIAFVVGRAGMGVRTRSGVHMTRDDVEKTHKEQGMFVLQTPENMNSDKSPLWFDTAARRFKWATHIGKIDMDTYPFLQKLLHRMEDRSGCPQGPNSYEVIGRPHDSYGPRFTNVCANNGCRQFASAALDFAVPVALPGQPWRFWSGEFYVLSLPLVQKVDWTSHQEIGTEDLQTAIHVAKAAQTEGFCVVLRRLDAWFHRSWDVNGTYANDF